MQPITDLSQLDPNKLYTYADYLTWQFTETVELFKGYVFPMAAPSACHELSFLHRYRHTTNKSNLLNIHRTAGRPRTKPGQPVVGKQLISSGCRSFIATQTTVGHRRSDG